MKLSQRPAELFIPFGGDEENALRRTTDLCIAAHQDDIEIMAYGPISACYRNPERWFTGVVVTDGAGSPRTGLYGEYSDETMTRTRFVEQKTAATVGEYSAQFLLAHPSAQVRGTGADAVVRELADIIRTCAPDTVYTHNLADKHDTHVAVALRAVEALRSLPEDQRPKRVYSLEVWRGLDWLCDGDKALFDTSGHENLAAALLGVFDSQIAGGKRYDSAAMGRRLANATFFASHDTDAVTSLSYGLDITDLINDPAATPEAFITRYIDRFRSEISERVRRLTL